jgi:hypothetical protein
VFGTHDDRFQLERTCARIRISMNDDGSPAWLHISIRGPLPHRGRVRQVYAVRTPAKPRASWSLVITLNESKAQRD